MATFIDLLLHHIGGRFPLNEYHLEHLQSHFQLLQKWNKKINLTSLEEVEEIVLRHYCESIALAFALPFGKLHVIDVGSGAGFPGVPFAIVRPDCFVYLVESDARKASFLRESALHLMNVVVLKQRLNTVEQSCDWLICRGVKWAEISEDVGRIADHVALMVGEESIPEIVADGDVRWRPAVPSPWGTKRVVLFGDLKPDIASP